MSSVLARRQVHNSNIFNFQGHIAQIRKEKLSWVRAAAAEHANQQLGLETISADLLGLPLDRLGIFCLLKATQNQTKSKSSNLLLLLFLDWWYPDDNSAGSSGTKSQWGTASCPEPGWPSQWREGPLASHYRVGMQISLLKANSPLQLSLPSLASASHCPDSAQWQAQTQSSSHQNVCVLLPYTTTWSSTYFC